MAKITFPVATTLDYLSTVNDNFVQVANEMNNKILYRDNPVGETNTMENDLDMNQNHIFNLPVPQNMNEAARLQDVVNAMTGIVPAAVIPFSPTANITSTNVQDAIEEVAHDAVFPVANIAALKAIPSDTYTRVSTAGYYTAGDNGDGTYRLDSTDLVSADNGGTIIVANNGARWKLVHSGEVSVRQFGAKGDGVTDDSVFIQKAVDTVTSVFFPRGIYYIASSITVTGNFRNIYGESRSSVLIRVTTNIPAFILDTDVSDMYFGTIHDLGFEFVVVGTRTDTSGIVIKGSSLRPLSYWQFTQLLFLGPYHGIRSIKSDNTAGEAALDWNLFTEITCTNSNTSDTNFGILFEYGSGTGNVFSDSNLVTITAGIQIGDGVRNCGDLVFSGIHFGGNADGIKLIGGSLYGSNQTVTNCQFDAGIDISLNFLNINHFTALGNNWGGDTRVNFVGCFGYTITGAGGLEPAGFSSDYQVRSAGMVDTPANISVREEKLMVVKKDLPIGYAVNIFKVSLSDFSGAYVEFTSCGLQQGTGYGMRTTRYHIFRSGGGPVVNILSNDLANVGLTNTAAVIGNDVVFSVSSTAAAINSDLTTSIKLFGDYSLLTKL